MVGLYSDFQRVLKVGSFDEVADKSDDVNKLIFLLNSKEIFFILKEHYSRTTLGDELNKLYEITVKLVRIAKIINPKDQ